MVASESTPNGEHDWQIGIGGMTCASCVARVEKALKKVPGVLDASVNLATESARVRASAVLTRELLSAAVVGAGYEANWPSLEPDVATGPTAQALALQREQTHLIVAAVLSLPLVLPMLALPFGTHWMLPGWMQWLLATPVQFWLGARFYRAAWGALKARSGNMDLLVAIGSSTSTPSRTTRAVAGRNACNARIASVVWRRARPSSHLPSRISVITTAEASKYSGAMACCVAVCSRWKKLSP